MDDRLITGGVTQLRWLTIIIWGSSRFSLCRQAS